MTPTTIHQNRSNTRARPCECFLPPRQTTIASPACPEENLQLPSYRYQTTPRQLVFVLRTPAESSPPPVPHTHTAETLSQPYAKCSRTYIRHSIDLCHWSSHAYAVSPDFDPKHSHHSLDISSSILISLRNTVLLHNPTSRWFNATT